jgi:hypothetical protein
MPLAGDDNQVGLKLYGAHQLLASADDVNLLGDNTVTVKKNRGTLIAARKADGLEVNIELPQQRAKSRLKDSITDHLK